jgi:hypothetical protein
LKDPENPDVDERIIQESSYENLDPIIKISPRLGFSFPTSENTVFFTHYGKFVQMTELQNIYSGNYEYSRILTGGFAYLNPTGRGLEPTETTNYEFGVRQAFSETAALKVSAFYRNIKGQIQPARVITDPSSAVKSYNTLVNGSFATTKGIEMQFDLRRTQRIQAQFNYTYSDAKGTESASNTGIAALERNTNNPSIISPLIFQQRHRGSLILDYRFADNDGGPVLENFGANLIFSFNSGHPFTLAGGEYGQTYPARSAVDFETDPRARQPLEPINASTTPWNFNFDLRLDKSFDIYYDVTGNVYLEVLNLLDTKNVINVYTRTGNANSDGYIDAFGNSSVEAAIAEYGEEFVDFYRAVNIDNGEAYRAVLGNELWDTPRQVRVGFKLSY